MPDRTKPEVLAFSSRNACPREDSEPAGRIEAVRPFDVLAAANLSGAGIAFPANEGIGNPVAVDGLKHRLSPVVEALLTNVVGRLRASWLAGPALLWADVHPIRQVAASDVDQRVATLLADGFFQFSQFLAGFEMLVLQLQEQGVVREQALLSLEQLLEERRRTFVDQRTVPHRTDSLGDVPRSSD